MDHEPVHARAAKLGAAARPLVGSARPPGDRRMLVVLCLASFLAVINFAAPAPFYPEIARDLGTSVPLLGQVSTAISLLSAALALVVGPVADRSGSRRLMIAGVVAVAANLAGTALAPSYGVLLGLAVVGGFGDAILFGLPLAIASRTFFGEDGRRAVGWVSAGLPIGSIAGVSLLAAFGGVVGWRAALGGAGAAALATAWLSDRWLPPDPPPPPDRLRLGAVLDAYRPLARRRSLLALYAVSAMRMACWIGLFTFLGAFLIEDRGFATGAVSVAYVVGGAGSFLGSLGAARLMSRFPVRPLVAAATAAQAALLTAVFALPLGAVGPLVLLPVAAACGSVGFVGVATLLTEETTGGASTTMVLNGSAINIGSAAGIALGGVLLAGGGYAALGLGLPILALAAAVLVVAVGADARRPAAAD
jgi:predicted MFS family arabinose efflux permease